MGKAPMVVQLDDPVKVKTSNGEMSLTEIQIGTLRAKHLKAMPAAMLEGKSVNPVKLLPLISELTGVSADTLGEIAFSDFLKVVAAVTDAMGEQLSSVETGNISSGE